MGMGVIEAGSGGRRCTLESSNWKMGVSGRIFGGWQLFYAIAALNTDAPKRSFCYRIRVTRSALSAALRWSRGRKAPTFPHTNLLNVGIEVMTSDREVEIAAAGEGS
jgi:hypothetical protein